jgi:WhiB family redox-sensing transcriptional regulator
MRRDWDWQQRAACRGLETSMFYPERHDKPTLRAALAVCNGTEDTPACPVRKECLECALSFPDDDDGFGVFGGHTPAERHRMRDKRRRPDTAVAVTADRMRAGGDTFTYRLSHLLNLIHDAVMSGDETEPS